MGIRSLRIEFTDGQNGVYVARQRLKGRVVIDFDKATKANSKFRNSMHLIIQLI